MSRRIRSAAFCALMGALGLGLPALCTAAGAPTSAATVEFVDGSTASGAVVAVAVDSVSLSIDGRDTTFPLADIRAVEFAGEADGPTASTWLLLSNGDRAPVEPIDLVDDQLVCRSLSGTERSVWRVPLELVSGLLRSPQVERNSALLSELSLRSFADDTLILSDGTRLAGTLETLAAGSFRLETVVGPVDVPAERISAVAMNAALIQQPAVHDLSVLAMLRDGTWLTLHELTVAQGEVFGRTGFNAEWRGRLADVVRLAWYGPRVADLTLRAPVEEVATPYISRRAQMRVNRSVRGHWLQLGDRVYPRGFGMTSGLRVKFLLEPGDRQFRTVVGIDESVGEAGSVVFVVELDGRRLYASPMLTGRDAPVVVGPLDVSDGERLTLSVEFAEQGHVQDVADWCDPVLLR